MSRLGVLALCLVGISAAFAQQPGNPSRAELSPIVQSSPAPQRAPEILPGLPPLDGPLASPSPPGPSLEELDALFKQSSLGKAGDEARLHVQWRELENRVINDAGLVAARRHAEAARTDLEKRRRLSAYYTLFFDRLKTIAGSPELQDYVEARKAEHIGLLAQPHVRPPPAGIAVPAPPPATPTIAPRPVPKPPEPELPH